MIWAGLKNRIYQQLIFAVLFTLLYFGVRAPFYSTPLFYEEGIFADIFINRPQAAPHYGQVGRIEGQEIYVNLVHPGFIYETMAGLGQAFQTLVPLKGVAKELQAARLRIIFSLAQYTFWLGLIGVLMWADRKTSRRFSLFAQGLLLVLACAPLAVQTSYVLQVDNTIGVLLVGFFACFLLLWGLNALPLRALMLFAALSGVVWGIGKNLWTILLVASMLFTLLFLLARRWVLKDRTPLKPDVLVLLFHLFGCTVTSGLNYWFDPVNYVTSIGLIFSRGSAIGAGFQAGAFQTWVNTTIFRAPYLFFGITATLIFLYIGIKCARSVPAAFVWGASYSVLLFFVFFFATYFTELRYFVVSYILQSAVMVMAYYLFPLPARGLLFARVSLVCILALSLVQYEQSLRQTAWERENRTTSELYLYLQHQRKMGEQTGCVPLMDIADAFEDDGQEYLSYSLSYETSLEYASRFGRQLCTR